MSSFHPYQGIANKIRGGQRWPNWIDFKPRRMTSLKPMNYVFQAMYHTLVCLAVLRRSNLLSEAKSTYSSKILFYIVKHIYELTHVHLGGLFNTQHFGGLVLMVPDSECW